MVPRREDGQPETSDQRINRLVDAKGDEIRTYVDKKIMASVSGEYPAQQKRGPDSYNKRDIGMFVALIIAVGGLVFSAGMRNADLKATTESIALLREDIKALSADLRNVRERLIQMESRRVR